MATRCDGRHPIIALGCVAVLAVGAAVGGGRVPAPAGQPADPANPMKLTPFIFGGRHCAACHDGSYNRSTTPEERDSRICRVLPVGVPESFRRIW
jgi:hypothetical protein